jgi:hypothetical protein
VLIALFPTAINVNILRMNSLGEADLQELALRAIVAKRCQRAYLHDLRGGLQAISSSFELLSRAANANPVNTELLEKSTAFFKRASSEHERTLGRSLEDICGSSEERAPLELRGLLQDVLSFLQNDALSKDVKLALLADDAVSVAAHRSNVRLVVLSLLTQGMDQSIPGTTIALRLSGSPRPMLDIAGIGGDRQSVAFGLLLPVSERLMAMDGGTIEPRGNGNLLTGWILRW